MAFARLRYIRISPFKLRRVVSRIQKLPCQKALAFLKFMPHKGAKIASKVLQSAVANTLNLDPALTEDELVIASAIVEEGNRVKKIWPRARGRADILHKRYSHLILRVDAVSQVKEEKSTSRKTGVLAPDKTTSTVGKKKEKA